MHFFKINPKFKALNKIIIIFIIALLPIWAKARPYEDLKSAFASGNVTVLSDHFDDKVNLFFNNQNNNLSTFQAKLLLENFFSSNKPKNFTVEDTGQSSYDGITYLVGKLETNAGNYRVYVLLRPSKSNEYIIKEIKFE